MRLVKDARLSLPLTEVINVMKLTSSLLDAPRQSSAWQKTCSSLSPKSVHALSLAHLPLLTFPTVLLPGNRLRSMPLTCNPTFPFFTQRLCVAKPEATSLSSAEPRALWSLTRPFALLSLLPNFLRLPPIFPPPLAQTKLPILC